MRAVALGLALVVGAPALVAAQDGPDRLLTRAERTDYRETTRYDEVVALARALAADDPRIHLTTFGYTWEGRPLPLLVVGDVEEASPGAVRRSGLTRVYLQGNIHGGEVCGKEALLMLLREVARGGHDDWLDSLVLLVAPVYNADGNERVSLVNRPRQHGPVGGMGQRPNAQGLDLNRDHMKLDSPEARSLARLLTQYDPHVAVDLHTTNGTTHAYHLTYSPPLHPGTAPGLIRLLRDEWLPEVTRAVKEADGEDFYYYGNAAPVEGEELLGWYTFDHRPRFNNNYVGLRNRLAILSEAYAYLSFEARVRSTLRFVEEILHFAAANASRIRETVEAVDARTVVGDTLPVRATFERSEAPVEILMGEVREVSNPYSGEPMLLRQEVRTPVRMWGLGTFRGTVREEVPAAYLVPPELEPALDRLAAHGLRLQRLGEERTLDVDVFTVDSAATAEREFQGHRERTLHGRWAPDRRAVAVGTVVVPLDQPLGRLAFYLLEARSDDGLAAWGLLDPWIRPGEPYPVLRARVAVDGTEPHDPPDR